MIRHIHKRSCDSTQDLLKEQLQHYPGETLLVSCEQQIKGRGRSDKLWTSLPGSLCLSLTIEAHTVMSFTALEMSLLVARFFEDCKLSLKWPNDLWNKHQQKCCGILVQNSNGVMMAGIGINLFSDEEAYGGVYEESFSFDKKAWSLEVANFILANRYEDTTSLKKDWEDRCGHLHQAVRITEGGMVIEGIFEGLGQYGEAVIATNEGHKNIFNGTLRPLSF